MSQSNYVTPRMGLKTAAVALAWMIGVYLLHQYYAAGANEPSVAAVTPSTVSSMLLLGSWYGVTAWSCWLFTAVPKTLSRLVLRIIALVIGSYLLDQHQGNHQWLKFMINLGGMLVIQSVMFFLLTIPGWKFGGAGREFENRQFSIGEMMLATTGISVLLGMTIRYQTPIDAKDYWLVLAGLWLWFPAISVCACSAGLRRSPFQQAFFLAIGLLLCTAGAFIGGHFERTLAGSRESDGASFALRYGTIMLGNLAVVFLLSLAGRWDAWQSSRDDGQGDPSRKGAEE